MTLSTSKSQCWSQLIELTLQRLSATAEVCPIAPPLRSTTRITASIAGSCWSGTCPVLQGSAPMRPLRRENRLEAVQPVHCRIPEFIFSITRKLQDDPFAVLAPHPIRTVPHEVPIRPGGSPGSRTDIAKKGASIHIIQAVMWVRLWNHTQLLLRDVASRQVYRMSRCKIWNPLPRTFVRKSEGIDCYTTYDDYQGNAAEF